MDNFTYLLLSHSTYRDVLGIHIKQLKKYLPTLKIVIAYNKPEELHFDDYEYDIIGYDDNLEYCERMSYVLTNIKTKYVLFNHDMNVLIDSPVDNIFSIITKYMDDNNVDQVRIFTGIKNPDMAPVFDKEKMYNKLSINDDYLFSINTGIWKTETLHNIFTNFKSHSYRCSECPEIQGYVNQFNNYYISSDEDIKLPNFDHYLSKYFPVIHITHNGKWCFYSPGIHNDSIVKLLDENNISTNTR